MEIKNLTNCKKAEEFLKEKLKDYDTERLVVTMKYCDVFPHAGFCRFPFKKVDGSRRGGYFNWKTGLFRITARVKPDIKERKFLDGLSYNLIEPIGSRQLDSHQWRYIFDAERIEDDDENMVFILGHEIWHYLCKTKQAKGNYQTKANLNGFNWLRKFKGRLKKENKNG